MEYQFEGSIINESVRTFISIPFNVWEKCKRKGIIPIRVTVDEVMFECKLVPKGDGNYYIPIPKSLIKNLNDCQIHNVSFEIIETLTRINNNSPYNIENPIRKINNIKRIIQPRDGLCGQSCIAMLTGISIEEVIKVMHCKEWQISFGKILETLDYFGIGYMDRMIYTRGKEVKLPICCIISERMEKCNHFLLHYKDRYYDSVLGVLEEYDMSKMIGYLEIITE